jgi:hypothetical protein
MELAAEAELGAVAEAATGGEGGSVAGVLVQVAAEPRLAFHEERSDMSIRVGPTAPAG